MYTFLFIGFKLGPDTRLFHLRFHHASHVLTHPFVLVVQLSGDVLSSVSTIFPSDVCRPSDCRVLGLSEVLDVTKPRFFTLTYTGDAAFVL